MKTTRRRFTEEEYIAAVTKKHGGRYDYSSTEYRGLSNPITYECPVHGMVSMSATTHLDGKAGCVQCHNESRVNTVAQFIEKAKAKHGDRYDYSLVSSGKVGDMIAIICGEHGVFHQRASNHVANGAGCPACGSNADTHDDFIAKAIAKHGSQYCYAKTRYFKGAIPVTITCRLHGDFEQSPETHKRGHGCPKCGDEARAVKFFKCDQRHIKR